MPPAPTGGYMTKSILLLSLAGALGGCATTSFAPPHINTQQRVVTTAATGCSSLTADRTPDNIGRNVDGAMDLIDNFELAYRCAQDELANGRRYFEIPAFLLGVAGLVGPSLGLSNDGVLLSGTGASVLGAGNGYFVPKAKASVVGAAHRAVVCIQTESVGLTAFKNQQDPPKLTENRAAFDELEKSLVRLQSQRENLDRRLAAGTAGTASGARVAELDAAHQRAVLLHAEAAARLVEAQMYGEVSIDAELQYFQMVSGGLLSVHSILGERLRNSGSADSTAVFNQLKDLAKKHKEAEDALAKGKPGAAGAQGFMGAAEAQRELVKLKIAELYPKIQTCVLQARL